MAKKYENIENINKLISGGAVAELSKRYPRLKSPLSIFSKSLTI